MKPLSVLTGGGGVPRWAGYRHRTQEVARLEDIRKTCRVKWHFLLDLKGGDYVKP